MPHGLVPNKRKAVTQKGAYVTRLGVNVTRLGAYVTRYDRASRRMTSNGDQSLSLEHELFSASDLRMVYRDQKFS